MSYSWVRMEELLQPRQPKVRQRKCKQSLVLRLLRDSIHLFLFEKEDAGCTCSSLSDPRMQHVVMVLLASPDARRQTRKPSLLRDCFSRRGQAEGHQRMAKGRTETIRGRSKRS